MDNGKKEDRQTRRKKPENRKQPDASAKSRRRARTERSEQRGKHEKSSESNPLVSPKNNSSTHSGGRRQKKSPSRARKASDRVANNDQPKNGRDLESKDENGKNARRSRNSKSMQKTDNTDGLYRDQKNDRKDLSTHSGSSRRKKTQRQTEASPIYGGVPNNIPQTSQYSTRGMTNSMTANNNTPTYHNGLVNNAPPIQRYSMHNMNRPNPGIAHNAQQQQMSRGYTGIANGMAPQMTQGNNRGRPQGPRMDSGLSVDSEEDEMRLANTIRQLHASALETSDNGTETKKRKSFWNRKSSPAQNEQQPSQILDLTGGDSDSVDDDVRIANMLRAINPAGQNGPNGYNPVATDTPTEEPQHAQKSRKSFMWNRGNEKANVEKQRSQDSGEFKKKNDASIYLEEATDQSDEMESGALANNGQDTPRVEKSKKKSSCCSLKMIILSGVVVILLAALVVVGIPYFTEGEDFKIPEMPDITTFFGGETSAPSMSFSPSTAPTDFRYIINIGERLPDDGGSVSAYEEVALFQTDDRGDQAAKSVSMSVDGNFVAVGYPQKYIGPGKVQVFDVSNGTFVPVGNPMVGERKGEMFGYCVSISEDGGIVAIGAPVTNYDSGYAIVYKYDSTFGVWARHGNVIDPTPSIVGGYAGGSLSLSADGTRLAVGMPRANSNNGVVVVYDYDETSNLWIPVGQIISGSNGELLGFSVSLNSKGDKIAIGAVASPRTAEKRGRVYIMHFVSRWEERGNPLFGADQFGRSVSLSADGNRVAIGSPGYGKGMFADAGVCEVFQFSDDWRQTWDPISGKLKGADKDEKAGFSIVLSSDGRRLGCGGKGDSIVRLYEEIGDEWEQIARTMPQTPYTDFGTALGMNENGDTFVIKSLSDDAIVSQGQLGDHGVLRLFQT